MDTTKTQEAVDTNKVSSVDIEEINKERARNQRRRALKRSLLVALVWAIVVLVVAFLVLFISSKVGGFDSIADMLYFISLHFEYSQLFSAK